MRYYIMKRRSVEPETTSASAVNALCQALLALDTPTQMRALLRDLCTPAELEALSDRWRVVPYLLDGIPYREIHDRTAVSITTIGRVARCLNDGHGGYRAVIERQQRVGSGSASRRKRA